MTGMMPRLHAAATPVRARRIEVERGPELHLPQLRAQMALRHVDAALLEGGPHRRDHVLMPGFVEVGEVHAPGEGLVLRRGQSYAAGRPKSEERDQAGARVELGRVDE